MSVEVGDLYLAITAPGGTAAERSLQRVDAAANKTASNVTRAMGAIERATATTTAGAGRLGGVLSSMGGAGGNALQRVATGISALPIGTLAAAAVAAGAVGSALLNYAKAADAARASTNLLRGAAIDAGRTFTEVKKEADAVRHQYGLTRDEATDLVTATARLANESHMAGVSQQFLAAAFNTARARGLDNADAVKMVAAAVGGSAEAIRELTGLRPEALYDAFAKRAGRLGKDLNEVGKQQALVNFALEQGAKRTTQAADAYDPLLKAQHESTQAMDDLKVMIGETLTPLRTMLNEWETGFARLATSTIPKVGDALRDLWTKSVAFTPMGMLSTLFGRRAQASATSSAIDPVALSPLLQHVGDFAGGGAPLGKPSADAFKEDEHAIDKLIKSLVALFEARKTDASQIGKSIALYYAEKKILDDTTKSLERRGQAAERMKALEGAGVIAIDRRKIDPMIEGPLKLDTTRPGMAKVVDAPEASPDTPEKFWTEYSLAFEAAGNRATDKTAEALKKYQRQVLGDAMKQDLQSIANDFAFFTRDAFGVAIDSIASGFEHGMGSMKDVLLSGLGSIFKAMGKHLMTAGAAMLKLLPFLSNPFTSGAAMIAAGAVVFAAGTALSAVANHGASAGGSVGVGGGIGSLGIGSGATQPQVYTFGQRGLQTPTGAVSRTDGNTYHFTVIGANDPVAQRQIMTLIDNAQTRGLGNGPNSRSV